MKKIINTLKDSLKNHHNSDQSNIFNIKFVFFLFKQNENLLFYIRKNIINNLDNENSSYKEALFSLYYKESFNKTKKIEREEKLKDLKVVLLKELVRKFETLEGNFKDFIDVIKPILTKTKNASNINSVLNNTITSFIKDNLSNLYSFFSLKLKSFFNPSYINQFLSYFNVFDKDEPSIIYNIKFTIDDNYNLLPTNFESDEKIQIKSEDYLNDLSEYVIKMYFSSLKKGF